MFELPKEVERIMEIITNAGFDAYLVGGCIRDFLMGEKPKDFDVTTDATPEEIHRVFDSRGEVHLIDTGIKQGTVTAILNHVPVEVTTFRKESSYSDNRHPDQVTFSKSIEDDLARRDFTMNAIAYNPRGNGEFVDLFYGQVDIKNSLVKAVGDPDERFREDALRIMRALRFASQLDFEIDEATARAMKTLKDSLNNISRERIQKELEGILCGKAVERILRDYREIIEVIIPEITPMVGLDQCTPYHIYDVWEHTIRVVSGISREPVLRLAALFHDIGKPSCFTKDEDGVGHFYGHPEVSTEIARRIMNRLKFDNHSKDKVLTLVRWHDLRPEPTERSLRRVLVKLGKENFDGWIQIKRADNRAQSHIVSDRQVVIDQLEEIGHRLIEREGVLSVKSLDISGRDLMNLGLKEGPSVGRILQLLLEDVMEQRISNSRDELINRAKKYLQ